MIPGFRFEENEHRFYCGQQEWPSVTQLIREAGYSERGAEYYTAASRQRGSAAHKTVALIDQYAPTATTIEEVLEVVEIDDRLVGYGAGYLLFKKEMRFTPCRNELAVGSRIWRVGGITDLYGRWSDGSSALGDVKTRQNPGTKPKRSEELQTGGYEILLEESEGLKSDSRFILVLPGDGRYRCLMCTNPTDKNIFQQISTIFWDRYCHGLVKIRGEEGEE